MRVAWQLFKDCGHQAHLVIAALPAEQRQPFGRSHMRQAREAPRTLSAPQQEDNEEDDQQKAQAATIVVIWSASIETAAAEQENQNNQDDYETHRPLLLDVLSAFKARIGNATRCKTFPPATTRGTCSRRWALSLRSAVHRRRRSLPPTGRISL
jgi:hypothetical protein